MYYSDELIEEIRMRNDIVDVISSYVKLQKKGNSYFGLCPFHNEKSPSFSVTPAKQMYYCFGCGEGGNVYTFLMKYENFTFVEAVKELARKAGISLPEQEMTGEQKKAADVRTRIMEINKLTAKYFYHQLRSEKGRRAYEYLKGRNLEDATIVKFGLGYSNQTSADLYQYLKKQRFGDDIIKESGLINYSEKGTYDKFRNRVMFPIMDVNNRVIGFGGRVMGEGEPKYLNSPETKVFDKSRNLYGLNNARLSKRKYILVCEGYMDVIALQQAGFTNAAASLGTAFTSQHASLMKRYTDEVICTFDSDGAGVKAALRAIPILRQAGLSVKVLNMKPYKDPDEFIKAVGCEAFEERIQQAENGFMFEIEKCKAEYDMNDPDSKTKFQQEVGRKLLVFEDEVQRNNYLDAVSREFMIPSEQLQRLVAAAAITENGAIKRERGEIKSIAGRRKPQESGLQKSQKLLLTWLCENPELYKKISKFISKEDFIDEPYSAIASDVFAQIEQFGECNPAQIMNRFTQMEEQTEAAAIFHTRLQGGEELESRGFAKALEDTVRNVKLHALEEKEKQEKDLKKVQEIWKLKKEWKTKKLQF